MANTLKIIGTVTLAGGVATALIGIFAEPAPWWIKIGAVVITAGVATGVSVIFWGKK